jgi:hypothetical protein
MLRQFRPLLARCALVCLVGVAAAPAMAAGFGMHAGPRVVMSPSYVRNAAPGRFGVRRQVIRPGQTTRPSQIARPERIVRQGQFDGQVGPRRFRGRLPWLGGVGGVGEVPAPYGIDASEPLPANPPAADYDNGFGAYPQVPVGPQIIVLPDARGNRGGSLRRRAIRDDRVASPSWRSAAAPAFPQWRAPRFARHRTARAWYEPAGPSYGYEPSPVALAPCTDGTHEAIYNTPCGVRPYE